MFSGISALSGTCRYFPDLEAASNSNQGYLLWLKPERALSITSRALERSRTPTTWPGFIIAEGMFTTLPSTTM